MTENEYTCPLTGESLRIMEETCKNCDYPHCNYSKINEKPVEYYVYSGFETKPQAEGLILALRHEKKIPILVEWLTHIDGPLFLVALKKGDENK